MLTFTLSTTDITERIYALTALHAVMHPDGADTPAALHRDHAAMLDAAVRAAFGRVCAALIPHVVECDAGTASVSELMTLTVAAVQAETGAAAMRQSALAQMLRLAVQTQAMAEVYAGHDETLAAGYRDGARAEIDGIVRVLTAQSAATSATASLRLRPAWL